jgi:hypothetical protein
MNTEPIIITIDIDELVVAVLARLEAADSMRWLRAQFRAHRSPDRRQQAWIARAAGERAKRRAQRRQAEAARAQSRDR